MNIFVGIVARPAVQTGIRLATARETQIDGRSVLVRRRDVRASLPLPPSACRNSPPGERPDALFGDMVGELLDHFVNPVRVAILLIRMPVGKQDAKKSAEDMAPGTLY
jgi:hypothetical protein